MKPIIATIDFTLCGKKFLKGKEVKVNSKEELIKLNEKGFVEPFSFAEIQEFGKEKNKKESDK